MLTKLGKQVFSLRNNWKRAAIQSTVALLLMIVLVVPAQQIAQAWTIPTTEIVSVIPDTSVTILTHNFPAGQTFTVRMGKYGTKALNGIVVGTTDSGDGGSFQVLYTIPDELKGLSKIAIRLDSPQDYFAYDWFYNNSSASMTATPTATSESGTTATPVPGFSGIPTFSITSVNPDDKVTIETNNFPAGLDFTVRMGAYGTKAIDGEVVGTTNSGSGGSFDATYTIPDSLKGSARIAIRMDSPTGFYFSYNWFYNVSGGFGIGGPTTSTPMPGYVGYTGIPTFSIESVSVDNTVTILTHNFPAGLDYTVRMGVYGTKGINGIDVATTNSGSGGSFEVTYNIPDELKGDTKIAIRLETAGSYAYNWFYNN
jgi:hypothetical protein